MVKSLNIDFNCAFGLNLYKYNLGKSTYVLFILAGKPLASILKYTRMSFRPYTADVTDVTGDLID